MPGLSELLRQLGLDHAVAPAQKWCDEMGAVCLEEVIENFDDFAETVELEPHERRLMEDDLSRRAAAAADVSPTVSDQAGVTPPLHRARSTFGCPEDPDRYELLEELGSGATCRVRRSVSAGGGTYAVKSINLAHLRKSPEFPQISEMLYQEIAILFSMQHPRIVPLFDVVWDTNMLRLVMEIVEGGELYDYIVVKGALAEPEARIIFVQIVEGLLYIHSKAFIWCDLKPENILIDKATSRTDVVAVRLTDFGHSQRLDDSESTSSARVGTPLYWAPEVAGLNLLVRGYDRRADLWSLGVVLYMMLVGKRPFGGDRTELQEQIRTANFSFGGKYGHCPSLQSQALIRSLIRTDPKDRLPLDWCLAHPWVETAGEMLRQILQDSEPLDIEEYFQLPSRPSVAKAQALRQDLQKWMARFRLSAIMGQHAVVANLGDSTELNTPRVEDARSEMHHILKDHFGVESPTRQVFIEKGLDGIQVHSDFQCWSSQLFACELRMSPLFGIGLDLDTEANGMRVMCVHSQPRQARLQPGDLIFQIEGHTLCGSLVLIEQTFGAHLRDGSQIAVRRDGTGERVYYEEEGSESLTSTSLRTRDDLDACHDTLRHKRVAQGPGRWILRERRRSHSTKGHGSGVWGPQPRVKNSGRPW